MKNTEARRKRKLTRQQDALAQQLAERTGRSVELSLAAVRCCPTGGLGEAADWLQKAARLEEIAGCPCEACLGALQKTKGNVDAAAEWLLAGGWKDGRFASRSQRKHQR